MSSEPDVAIPEAAAPPLSPGDFTQPRRPTAAGATAVVLLVAVVAAIVVAMRPPAPVGAQAPAEAFSAERATAHLRHIAATPHPVGSAEHDTVKRYLTKQLTGLGLDVRTVDGTAANPRLGAPFPVGRVSTLTARLPGNGGGGTIYVDAHYDSVRGGAGTNDDGVAVASLLEVARALTAGPRLRNDVVFVLSDGEEPGLLGTRLLLDKLAPAPQASVVLNLEARGSSGPVVMFETSPANAGVISHFAKAAHPLGFSLSGEIYKRLPNDTNFTEYRDAGFTGLNMAYLDGSPYYHSSADGLAHINQAGLQDHGDLALSLARSLGDADLAGLDSGAATYFWLPGFLARYPNGLAVPLAVLALVATTAAVLLARRRGVLRLRRFACSVAWTAIPVIVAPVAASVLWLLASLARPRYAAFVLGDAYQPGWYRAAFTTLALAITVAAYFVMRRRLGGPALFLAGTAWLAVLGMLVTIAAPAAGYLFVLPALVWAGGALLWLAAGGRGGGWVAAVTAGGVVAAVVGVPIIALLYPALGIANAAVPTILIVLLALPAAPLTALAVPHGHGRAVAVAAVAALAMFAAGLVTSPEDAAHPTPTSLVYALDADTGQARWLSADAAPNGWTKAYVGDTRAPMEQEFPPLTGAFITSYLTGPAPAAPLAAPRVTVIDSRQTPDGRTVRIRLVSPRGAPVLWLHVAADAPRITAATVDGRSVPGDVAPAVAGGAWGWGFGFYGLPAEGVEVSLTFAGTSPVRVRVIDQLDGLDGLPGYAPMPPTMTMSPLPADASYVAATLRV